MSRMRAKLRSTFSALSLKAWRATVLLRSGRDSASLRHHRVTGSGRPLPVPTERGVRFLLRCTFGVPHHALRQVVHSTFAAIRSKSVSMVSLILSLHRGLLLPLNGAHVAPERVTCRRPLPPALPSSEYYQPV